MAPSIHRAPTTGFNVSAFIRVPLVLALVFHSTPRVTGVKLAATQPNKLPETAGGVKRPAVSFVCTRNTCTDVGVFFFFLAGFSPISRPNSEIKDLGYTGSREIHDPLRPFCPL
ncbi:hypothetical protein F5144DRAFT_296952 [Chaetomium tenue]|uniref:Uncharacterized protein n=1 Tax=Chaetomium tenue TaxID=1854479 RepID=A0ACB7P5C6_9PEZI|nr:hypothetical protein F5144DRAFT_296952 [Chaetomium globosum]